MSSSSSISVEAFLWHPHSIKYSVSESKYAYNDQLLANMDCEEEDDCSSSRRSTQSSPSSASSALQISLPPRMVLMQKKGQDDLAYDLQQIAEHWAVRRRYRIISSGHVIACTKTKKLLFIDFVMERVRDAATVLACVYYTPCRGGEGLRVAKEYMQEIQSVCNSQMKFFPRVLALCIYDSSELSRAASLYRFASATETCFSSSFVVRGTTTRDSSCWRSSSSRRTRRQQQQQHKRNNHHHHCCNSSSSSSSSNNRKSEIVFPKVYATDVTKTEQYSD